MFGDIAYRPDTVFVLKSQIKFQMHVTVTYFQFTTYPYPKMKTWYQDMMVLDLKL